MKIRIKKSILKEAVRRILKQNDQDFGSQEANQRRYRKHKRERYGNTKRQIRPYEDLYAADIIKNFVDREYNSVKSTRSEPNQNGMIHYTIYFHKDIDELQSFKPAMRRAWKRQKSGAIGIGHNGNQLNILTPTKEGRLGKGASK